MSDEPLPQSSLILYQTEDGRTRVQCRFENETLWLTQAQIAELFETTPQNVTLHLKGIFAEGELVEAATCKDYLQVRLEGGREVSRKLKHYRLEAILAVGFRVRSHRGTQFRQWATARCGSGQGLSKPSQRHQATQQVGHPFSGDQCGRGVGQSSARDPFTGGGGAGLLHCTRGKCGSSGDCSGRLGLRGAANSSRRQRGAAQTLRKRQDLLQTGSNADRPQPVSSS